MEFCFRRASLILALVLAAAVSASAQDVSFRPVFTLGVGYDSNIFVVTDEPTADWYGHVTMNLPLRYRASQRSLLSLSYRAEGEWYNEQTQLDDQPSRQNASLNYDYGVERGFRFGLRGSYNESQRPEDVFTESGVDFGRQQARNASAGTSLGHSLGQHGRLSVDYDYSRALYRDEQRSDYHAASLTLGRQLGRRTRLDGRYSYSEYLFREKGTASDLERRTSQVATLGISQSLGRATSLSVAGGARLTDGSTTPEANASLTRAWRGGALFVSIGHTQAFVPARDAEDSLSVVDRANLSLTFFGRRYRIFLSPSYYRNRVERSVIEDFESRTWRGFFDAVYNLSRWLGLGFNYQFTYQESTDPLRDKAKRHVARVNFVIKPWADRAGFAGPR